MVKKRLIFTLHWSDGNFMLSRNFRIQKVGDLEWLKRNYNFKEIAFSIDELILLNVTRERKDINSFAGEIKKVIDNCFIPVAVGGGIKVVEDAENLFNSGAEKIIINSLLFDNPSMVEKLVVKYGSQAVIASVDYKYNNGEYEIYINNGADKIPLSMEEYLQHLVNLQVGEVFLNSMDRDGTGQGYDLYNINLLIEDLTIPVILSGGAGKFQHLIEGISLSGVDAVATANLFNFIGNGLPDAREQMITTGIDLAVWERDGWKKYENYFK